MLTNEMKMAHVKANLALIHDKITDEQHKHCLEGETPVDVMRRLHAYQRQNATPTFAAFMAQPQTATQPATPKPPVMNRVLGIIVGIIVGVIALGWLGGIVGAFFHAASLGTGIGSVVGLIPGYLLGRHLTSPKA